MRCAGQLGSMERIGGAVLTIEGVNGANVRSEVPRDIGQILFPPRSI
jgi:hypothetical protein